MKDPQKHFKAGTVLIWLGVLVWVPYFALRLAGEGPNLMAFLPFHLLGVIGGARMRTDARKKLGMPKPVKKGYRKVAHWLVLLSISVWLVYYGLKLSGRSVEITPFLNLHLVTIFSGTGLMVAGGLVEQFMKINGRGAKRPQSEPAKGVTHGIEYSKEEAG